MFAQRRYLSWEVVGGFDGSGESRGVDAGDMSTARSLVRVGLRVGRGWVRSS